MTHVMVIAATREHALRVCEQLGLPRERAHTPEDNAMIHGTGDAIIICLGRQHWTWAQRTEIDLALAPVVAVGGVVLHEWRYEETASRPFDATENDSQRLSGFRGYMS